MMQVKERTIRGQAHNRAISLRLVKVADTLAEEERLPKDAVIDQLARLAVISTRIEPNGADLDFEMLSPLDDEEEAARKARLFFDSRCVAWVDRAIMLIDRADRPDPVTAPEAPSDPN